jgi:hypothetical protein
MIVMRMCGGLGNQMFQYALGRRLSFDRKAPLLLDIAPFDTTAERGETPRSYRLNFLRIQAEATRDWPSAVKDSFPPGSRIEMAGISEEGDAFNPQVLQCPENTYLIGYWQSEKYFVDIADQIRADFQLASVMTADRQALAAQIAKGEAVSIHIRRGDYVTHPGSILTFGTCAPEWYAKAMSLMADRVDNPRFYVFSDDPEWVRANLPKYEGTVFVDPQPDGREFEDMHLMSKCRHHILANSSFSWWGAWLNSSPDKKVIAPERWALVETNLNDRLPASWVRF